MSQRLRASLTTLLLGLAMAACGDGDDDAATSTASQPSSAPADLGEDADIIEENDLVYLTDDEGTWTLDVAYPRRGRAVAADRRDPPTDPQRRSSFGPR